MYVVLGIIVEAFKLTYEKGVMVVRHSSGVVSRYYPKDLQEQKGELLEQRQELLAEIVTVESRVLKMEKSNV